MIKTKILLNGTEQKLVLSCLQLLSGVLGARPCLHTASWGVGAAIFGQKIENESPEKVDLGVSNGL